METPGVPPVLRRRGYRAGILGAGFMGTVHARAIRVSGGDVVGVVGSSAESSRRAAERLDAERAFTSAEQLIDSPLIDVVHICTPNHLHLPHARAAIAAGKHVVCEKPLATSVGAAEELTSAVSASGLVGTVPFVYRFHPMVREAREMVRRGGLGRVSLAHGSYLQDWLSAPQDDDWRVDAVQGGPTRAFGDIGSHWCDLLEFVTGDRIHRLSAQTSIVIPERRPGAPSAVTTEDIVTLQFQTVGGVVGTSSISQVSPGRKNRLLLEVSGTEATVAFDQEQPELLWRGGRTGSSLLVRDPATLSPAAAAYARVPAGHAQGYQDCFDSFVADTAAAVRGAGPDGLPVFADGLRSARIADAVLRSAVEQAWVEVAA